MADKNEVFETLKEILVDALGVDEDEVHPHSQLHADLGAESIDILDISFRIEEEWDVSLPTKEWTDLFSSQTGQLPLAELAAHLGNDYDVELTDEESETWGDKPLGEILDHVESTRGVEIDGDRRVHYASLGTRGLLEGFEQLLHSEIDAETREAIVLAAASCGFDEHFWFTMARVFTVARLVSFVESKLEEREDAAAGPSGAEAAA